MNWNRRPLAPSGRNPSGSSTNRPGKQVSAGDQTDQEQLGLVVTDQEQLGLVAGDQEQLGALGADQEQLGLVVTDQEQLGLVAGDQAGTPRNVTRRHAA